MRPQPVYIVPEPTVGWLFLKLLFVGALLYGAVLVAIAGFFLSLIVGMIRR